MPVTQKFAKVDKNVLVEYIYNSGNLISEQYEIITNIKSGVNSFVSTNTSITNNILTNQLFQIDPVQNMYGIVNPAYYSFLQESNYAAGIPLEYDTINIYVPTNYTFGQYIGCYIHVYTYGFDNVTLFELSNFYFDMTNINQSYLMNYTSPPLYFQEAQWGKNLEIQIPAVSALSSQRINNVTQQNSMNANLTNGLGLSLTSPVFIDFQFINKSQVLNGITTYFLAPKITITIPQTPDYQQLGLVIQHASDGDYFEIFGTYNGTGAGLETFINNSVSIGNNFYVTYNITMFEQNIQGQSLTITVNSNGDFSAPIEYRPIIKNSTTTAIIDVEMNVIDSVNNSSITRQASYGMLQNEVAKYSLLLSKINLSNASVPIIYNSRSGSANGFGGNSGNANTGLGQGINTAAGATNITIQPVNVPYPVLVNSSNIVAKSTNVVLQNATVFYGLGQLMINIYPFDNVVQFIIASNVVAGAAANTVATIDYLDMSSMGDIEMGFQNSTTSVSVPVYSATSGTTASQTNLSIGQVVFFIPQSKIADIRTIFNSGINVFYITSTSAY
jgi:hypothetical protein